MSCDRCCIDDGDGIAGFDQMETQLLAVDTRGLHRHDAGTSGNLMTLHPADETLKATRVLLEGGTGRGQLTIGQERSDKGSISDIDADRMTGGSTWDSTGTRSWCCFSCHVGYRIGYCTEPAWTY